MLDEKFLVRNIDADKLFQNFMITAIASLLSIRLFLKLAKNPVLGGEVAVTNMILGTIILIAGIAFLFIMLGGYYKEIALILGGLAVVILAFTIIGGMISEFSDSGNTTSFHIAHMLWGGLLMLLAIIMLFALLGKHAANIAAVIGGVGFGAFIDELGKFVTSDNNYFFQPSIAIIYATLITIYIGFRLFKKYSMLSEDEYLINAIEYLKESVNNSLNADDKRKAMNLLNKCDKDNPVVKSLKKLFRSIDSIPQKAGPIAKTRKMLRATYVWTISKKKFTAAVIWFFAIMSLAALWNATTEFEGMRVPLASAIVAIYAAYKLAKERKKISATGKIMLIIAGAAAAALFLNLMQGIKLPEMPAMELLEIASSIIAGSFVLAGIWNIRKSRLKAYNLFKHSVLVSIFLTQFFAFYREQFGAVLGLFGNIAILIVLEYVIDEEEALAKNGGRKNEKRGN